MGSGKQFTGQFQFWSTGILWSVIVPEQLHDCLHVSLSGFAVLRTLQGPQRLLALPGSAAGSSCQGASSGEMRPCGSGSIVRHGMRRWRSLPCEEMSITETKGKDQGPSRKYHGIQHILFFSVEAHCSSSQVVWAFITRERAILGPPKMTKAVSPQSPPTITK